MHDRHSRELRRHYWWSTFWPILSWSSEGSMLCHTYTVTSTYPQLSSLTTMEQWGFYAVQHLYCDFALSLALESYNKGAVSVLCRVTLPRELWTSVFIVSLERLKYEYNFRIQHWHSRTFFTSSLLPSNR